MTISRIKNIFSTTAIFFLTFVVVGSGITIVSSASASAASGTCTSKGYTQIGTHPILMTKTGGSKIRTGTLEIYYKNSTGKNCAMARCNPDGWCFNMYRVVAIKDGSNTSNWEGWDGGMYKSYAGSVETKHSTTGHCIDVYAAFSQSATATNPTAFGGGGFNDKYCS